MTHKTYTSRKLNKIIKLSKTARFPLTFKAIIGRIDSALYNKLTALQIAAIIDLMHEQSQYGYNKGLDEAA